ncbi:MAG: ATP-dependent dethiobiotin synthetase BioD [Actinomycetota bacterium]
MTDRPRRLVVVTGTGTEVGKTWFAAATLRALRETGVRVAARKPVQSFEPGAGPTDADVLATATGERPDVVCPPSRSLGAAMAPPMAADALGLPPFTVAELAADIGWSAGIEVGVVEGVGGPRSPLAADGDTVDLVAALRPDALVLVADAGLGAINAVRLSVASFDDHEVVVALNRYDETDDVNRRNREWLADRAGLDVVVAPDALATRLRR